MNMKLKKITRTDSLVRYRFEQTAEKTKANDKNKPGETVESQGAKECDITEHDAPVEKFDTCLQALGPVAAKVLEMSPDWARSVTVHTLTVSYTKKGTRSASIGFTKALDATSSNHGMDTPIFQIDDASPGEEGRRQVHQKHADTVIEMIKQAEAYIKGKRGQLTLPLNSTKAEAAKDAGGSLVLLPEGREGDGT